MPRSRSFRRALAGSICALLAAACDAPAPRGGAYLGEPLPGDKPQLFAPGVVARGWGERDTAISPAGDRIYWTLWWLSEGTILFVERDGDRWSAPEVAGFSGLANDLEPSFDPTDGDRLLFASRRPLPGESAEGDWNLWEVRRAGAVWGEPAPLPGVNADGDEYYPSLAADGTLYFTARRDGGQGDEDIWRARFSGGTYATAENLGPAINGPGPEFNAFVAPDESYLLFSSVREGDEGGGDLYLSLRDAESGWRPARALGPRINSDRLDYCPFVTPDGRYLFFSSTRADTGTPGARRTLAGMATALEGVRNGRGALFWVTFDAESAYEEEAH